MCQATARGTGGDGDLTGNGLTCGGRRSGRVALIELSGVLRLDTVAQHASPAAASGSVRMVDAPREAITAATRGTARQQVTQQISADQLAGSHARRMIDQACTRWRLTTLRDPARVIASELVSNALQHAIPPIELCVITDDRVLRIEVSDHSTTPPDTLRSTSELHYGLRLVDTLTSRWGVTPTTTGKTVWAELPLPPHDTTSNSEGSIALAPLILGEELRSCPSPLSVETGSIP